MTPAPTPQAPDHGSAGFCTNHAQRPDERTEAVVRGLRGHEWDGGDTLNLGYYRTEATCICGITYWGGDHDEDPSLADALIAHQAAAVVAVLDDESARLRAASQSVVGAVLRAGESDRAALDRVRALAAPKWRSIPTDLPDATAEAYSRGRNDTIDAVRAALDPEEPR